MFKDLKYDMQEATSNANFPWAEECLNATDRFPLILSNSIDAFPQAKGIFFTSQLFLGWKTTSSWWSFDFLLARPPSLLM